MHFHCTAGDVADSFDSPGWLGFCNPSWPKSQVPGGFWAAPGTV